MMKISLAKAILSMFVAFLALVTLCFTSACSGKKNYPDLQKQTLMYSQKAKFTLGGQDKRGQSNQSTTSIPKNQSTLNDNGTPQNQSNHSDFQNAPQTPAENISIVVSYLNPSLQLWEGEDIFVLSVSPKDARAELISARFGRYKGVLKPIKQGSELAKYLVNSPFMAHYQVRFPYKDDDTITLQLCLAAQCVELGFQKYSKSLYYRPEADDK